MNFPHLSDNYFQERAGVNAVAQKLTAMRCLWRETPNADIGIDGQIELVNDDGFCPGQVLAAQVKSGPSYFKLSNNEEIIFYPEEKHRHYWANFPLPVILIVYNPETDIACWVDARRYLRSSTTGHEAAISIPRANTLDGEHRAALLETCGSFEEKLLTVEQVVQQLAAQRSSTPGFDVTYLDLFGFGLTDICRKLFFSIGLGMEIAEWRAAGHGIGVGIGGAEYEFVNRYIRFLISQNLVYYDFYDFLIDWEEREMTPIFLCPLTPRGGAVVEELHRIRSGLFHERLITIDLGFRDDELEEVKRIAVTLADAT